MSWRGKLGFLYYSNYKNADIKQSQCSYYFIWIHVNLIKLYIDYSQAKQTFGLF